MALTPEEIEGRDFPVAQDGYDRASVDRFLAEVAASYRYAVHNLLPGVQAARAKVVAEDHAPGTDDSFTRLGEEVADLLRSSSRMAETVVAQAHRDADTIRSEAEMVAAELRQEAERERDQARRVLVHAKEQADTMAAEAEEHARVRLDQAEVEAGQRAEQVLAGSRRHAEQIQRAEQAAVERLQAVRAEIDRSITHLTGSEEDPVVDLTSGEAVVRVGEAKNSHDRRKSSSPDRRPASIDPERDPVRILVRAAVGRASQHSAAANGDREGADQGLGADEG